jgi:two-component system response regulator VicR
MLTAKEEEVDKVLGPGARRRRYITKPFGMRVLIARIKANIKTDRSGRKSSGFPSNIRISAACGHRFEQIRSKKKRQSADLTLREYELLKYLAERENKVFSRDSFLRRFGDRVFTATYDRGVTCGDYGKSLRTIRAIPIHHDKKRD